MKIPFLLSALAAVTSAYVGACDRGMYWEMKACQCFKVETCAPYVRCGYETIPDPRVDCKCIPYQEVNALYEHAGLDEKCEKISTSTTVQEPKPSTSSSLTYDCDDQDKKICLIKAKCLDG